MLKYLLFFLLFILPVVVFPFGSSFFELPKVVMAQLGISLLIVSLGLKYHKNLIHKISPLHLGLAGILIILSLIHLIFYHTETAFFGNVFRLQGTFLLWHLLLFSLFSPLVDLKKLPAWIFFIPLILLILSVFIIGPSENGRALGSLGEANALAGTLIFVWPWFFYKSTNWFIRFGSLITALIFIILSGSRSGLLALGIQAVFVFISLKWGIVRSLALSLIILGLSFLLPMIEGGGLFENRIEIWNTALVRGLGNPVLGGGFGNVEQLLSEGARVLNNNLQYQYVDSAHNIWLDYWLQGGIVGLVVLLVLVFKSLQHFIRQERRLEAVLLIGIITVMSFNPVSAVTLIHFWWLIGQGQNNGTK